MSTRSKVLFGAGIAAVIFVGGGVVLWLLLRGDAPPPVSLEEAVESAEGDESSTDDEAGSGLEGSWTVDTSIGRASRPISSRRPPSL